MIDRSVLFHLPFYELSCFHGSFQGMRYRISKSKPDDASETVFLVTVYPGPYGYDSTPDEKKLTKEFPYKEESLDLICDWLNNTYKNDLSKWKQD